MAPPQPSTDPQRPRPLPHLAPDPRPSPVQVPAAANHGLAGGLQADVTREGPAIAAAAAAAATAAGSPLRAAGRRHLPPPLTPRPPAPLAVAPANQNAARLLVKTRDGPPPEKRYWMARRLFVLVHSELGANWLQDFDGRPRSPITLRQHGRDNMAAALPWRRASFPPLAVTTATTQGPEGRRDAQAAALIG